MRRGLGRGITFVGGLGLGAGLAYVLDPQRGARRRAIARDKVVHFAHAEREEVNKGIRDLRHRGAGLLARMRTAFSSSEVSDEVLVARVRSKLGRCVAHPGAIEVSAVDGRVTLSGPIFADEVDHALRCVRRVRGVREVEQYLEPHETADNVAALQGERRRIARPAPLRDSWPPSLRLIGTAGGALLGIYGLRRRGIVGTLGTATGGVLLARSLINQPAVRLFGLRPGPAAVRVQKAIVVHAPIDEVFEFWSKLENFPRFMHHIRRIEVVPDTRRSVWTVDGPAGVPLSWEAEITRMMPNDVLEWRTLPGASVDHRGKVRFERVDERATRIHVQMLYRPPAGAVGHAVAALFRRDPKRAMDDDLLRMKSLLEQGVARAHGERVHFQELQ